MKKYLKALILTVVISLLIVNNPFFAVEKVDDRTLSEIQADIDRLNQEQETLQTEVDILGDDIQKIGESISVTQATISETRGKIEELEKKIPVAKDNASSMLKFLQMTQNGSFLVELTSGTLAENQKKSEALNKLIDEATTIITNLLLLEQQLALEKKNLENEEQKLTALKVEKSKQMEAKKDAINLAAAEAKTTEDIKSIYTEAGCKNNEVFGVDCGFPPPPPAPEPGTGGGATSGGTFIRPVAGSYITEDFGYYSETSINHNGIDIGVFTGHPVFPVGYGRVVSVVNGCGVGDYSCGGGFGNHVVIMHRVNGQTIFSVYAHLSAAYVSQGQIVSAYDQIGISGNSGYSFGEHLHLEMIPDSNGDGSPGYGYENVNPRNYINFPGIGTYFGTR